jgi:hypothetical protein
MAGFWLVYQARPRRKMLGRQLTDVKLGCRFTLKGGKAMVKTGLSEKDISEIKNLLKSSIQNLKDGDFSTWLSWWMKDAYIMPPNHPRTEGHDALLKFIRLLKFRHPDPIVNPHITNRVQSHLLCRGKHRVRS